MDFVITPAQLEIESVIVSLDLAGGPGRWILTVMLSRRAGSAPLPSTDVAVSATRDEGREMLPLEQPQADLTEFGGSLGTTASARYVFAGEAWPRAVTVRMADGVADFAVAEAAT
ncbi:hypothetical protein E5A73_16315 [Sphingomonas gei]|uniref:Uncharacterized protein n=1 Tax=Sphingomonas gei TaxID=1395960 RepID=A0A4S1XA92_9SPHN|nr:hypothetical protein [Sphingomonas gei]TGX52357.1 hypothetical protein E5A73_16315 [Sphingomonas gei]